MLQLDYRREQFEQELREGNYLEVSKVVQLIEQLCENMNRLMDEEIMRASDNTLKEAMERLNYRIRVLVSDIDLGTE